MNEESHRILRKPPDERSVDEVTHLAKVLSSRIKFFIDIKQQLNENVVYEITKKLVLKKNKQGDILFR